MNQENQHFEYVDIVNRVCRLAINQSRLKQLRDRAALLSKDLDSVLVINSQEDLDKHLSLKSDLELIDKESWACSAEIDAAISDLTEAWDSLNLHRDTKIAVSYWGARYVVSYDYVQHCACVQRFDEKVTA